MTTTVAPASAQAFDLPAGRALRVTEPEPEASPVRELSCVAGPDHLVVALAACADVTRTPGGRCGPPLVDVVPPERGAP